MKWGLLAGLGEGLKFTSAAMYEQAKAAELQKIRQQEREEDRKYAVEDREARKADAMDLAKWERDNAGTWEQVLDEDGNVIAQKHSVTGETKPLDLSKDDEIRRVYQNSVDLVQDAFTQYGDVEAMPESIKGRVENALAIVTAYESRFLPKGAGADGAGAGGNKDDEVEAGMGSPETLPRNPRPEPATPVPFASAGNRDWIGEAQQGLNRQGGTGMLFNRSGPSAPAAPASGYDRPNNVQTAPWVGQAVDRVLNQERPEKLPSFRGF